MQDAADPSSIDRFVSLIGREAWQSRIDAIVAAQPLPGRTSHHGRDVLRRHAIEISIERGRRPASPSADIRRTAADLRLRRLTTEAVALHARLAKPARRRLEARLADAMLDGQSLYPLFHLLRTACLHRGRGFDVDETGLLDETPYDLLIERGGVSAEVACDVVSAESGRDVHRDAWFRLADMVGPDLQTWLAAHPGRYLLNMTLPKGLRVEHGGPCPVASLRGRITTFLADRRRQDQDEAVVMRLDNLVLAGARGAGEQNIVSDMRGRFGPDAHLAVTLAGDAVFVMAAQASRANDVPGAVRRRLEALAPTRFTGTRPAILSMFVSETELGEWRRLHRDLSLEGEVRQFLATSAARHVAAVSCSSRHEMIDAEDDAAEIRYRSPLRSTAKLEALAPSITSSIGAS